jgi:hypothetical protein
MTVLPDYCSSFQEEAEIVWRAMSDARRLGVPRNEETTTETLLLNLAKKHSGRGLTIKTFSKGLESKIGADWGFWFADSSGKGIAVRVQAKRFFAETKRRSYNSLYHQSLSQREKSQISGLPTPNQCEVLLQAKDGAIPLYVFYNDDSLRLPVVSSKRTLLCILKHGPHSVANSSWGISAASALEIKRAKWGKNNLPSSFRMVPWHHLVCPSCWDSPTTNSSLPSIIGNGLRQLYSYKSLDLEEDAERELSELPFKFEPTSKIPSWASLLLKGSASEESLAAEMDELNLKGMAIIQETEARDD